METITANTSAAARWARVALAGASPELSDELQAALSDLDGSELLRLAERHRIAPWLLAAITPAPAGTCPETLESGLRSIAERQVSRSLSAYQQLVSLARELDRSSIPVMLLKGPAVADRYYPDPALRPYGDVDLLVGEQHLKHVVQSLQGRGYHELYDNDQTPLHEHHAHLQRTFINDQIGAVVDVHADHLQLGLRPVDLEVIWHRSEEARFGGASVRVLGREDLFLLLSVHVHRHGFDRLIWLKDLDLMIRRGDLDWAFIADRAAEEGCLASVALTLELVEATLGVPLEPGARELIRRRSWVTKRVQRLLWPTNDVIGLRERPRWWRRRAVQFAPEAGALRGGLPSLFFHGRRLDKLRVLGAALRPRRSH